MQSYINDPIRLCIVAVFSDADFNGGLAASKSTSGGYIAIVGSNTWAPIAGTYTSQAAVRHSSTESELLALDFALRPEVIPVCGLWQFLAGNLRAQSGAEGPAGVGRTPIMMVSKDNEAVVKTTRRERSMPLRRVLRTHRVAMALRILRIDTKKHVADIFTKGFNSGETWPTLLGLCSPYTSCVKRQNKVTPMTHVVPEAFAHHYTVSPCINQVVDCQSERSDDKRTCAAVCVQSRRRDTQCFERDSGTMVSFLPAPCSLPPGPSLSASSSQAPGTTALPVGQSGAEGPAGQSETQVLQTEASYAKLARCSPPSGKPYGQKVRRS